MNASDPIPVFSFKLRDFASQVSPGFNGEKVGRPRGLMVSSLVLRAGDQNAVQTQVEPAAPAKKKKKEEMRRRV